MATVGRNTPCPCGSGQKYKRCCGAPQPAAPKEPEPRIAGSHLRLLVSLDGAKPPIWRRFLLRADATFADLHDAIQACGWDDAHPYVFLGAVDDRDLARGPGVDDEASEAPAAASVPLARHLRKAGDACRYLYDFGDDWKHVVFVEAVETIAETFTRRLLDGGGAFPPEDCGGLSGLARLLEFEATGEDPWGDAESLREWVDDRTISDFDLAAARAAFDRPPTLPAPLPANPKATPLPAPDTDRVRAFDHAAIDRLAKALRTELQQMADRFGVQLDLGTISWTRNKLDTRVSLAVIRDDGVVMNRDAETFLQRCDDFAFEPGDLGRVFELDGERWQVAGLSPRARAPVICTGLDRPGRKQMRFPAGLVRLELQRGR